MFDRPKLTDNVVFSYLMSTTGAEPAVESFINATLEDDGLPPIKNVQILNPFTMSNFKDGKVSILDVKVQDQDGRFFNVEMQTANKIGFKERILYYGGKLYSSQLVKGDGYEKLKPVISIIVARFVMFPELLGQHNVFTLRAKRDPNVVFSKQIQVHSLELTKKQLPEIPAISPRLFNWFDFLTNGHEKTESEMSTLLEDSGLAVAADNYNQFCQNAKLRELAWVQEKTERDRISEMGYIIQEARQEGWNEGREEGWNKGREEGWNKGRQEGWNKGREEGLNEGREEGRAEERMIFKNAILRNFSRWYPKADSSEIQQILQTVNKADDLNRLQDLFFDCQTASEFLMRAREIK